MTALRNATILVASRQNFYNIYMLRSRGYLPHLELPNAIYFVTFRLADSLPRHIIEKFVEEHTILKERRRTSQLLSSSETGTINYQQFIDYYDTQLDKGHGQSIMKNQAAAEIVANALKYFDGDRFRIHAWCVMPNHVHVVFNLLNNNKLSNVVSSWKSFTSNEINKALGRNGHLWQREYYDYILRDEAEYNHTLEYVEFNPVKAGLKNWVWCSNTSHMNDLIIKICRQDDGVT